MAAAATDTSPIRSSCHCGAITVTVPRLPAYINVCQCTICRRYGAAWGYYSPDEVKIEKKPGAATKQYIWGDSDLSFNFCDHCGCVCYWWPIRPPPPPSADGEEYQMGLNTNNVDPELLRFVDRKLEYSVLKSPLRSKDMAHPDDPAQY
ncbi:glutathione-dependent formaldehyde-activating gfa [Phlyctema vagabunda]|uniref:Glutathione-dependent formaldehyde-activating gfa n=1 Tax=Phlyctema vagabunda TaxID=108571 RepID=A0ABR4PXZ5_9HELO